MPSADNAALPATFNRLAWSNLAAQSAEQIALAAAPIVAVLLLGVGEGETGLLQTALTLPFVLFAIPAGLIADRWSRRRLMAGAEALRALALLAILLLIWAGLMTLPLLAALGFAAVCGTVVYSVAAPALVPSLVTPQLLPAANARIELARTVAFASGPAVGGRRGASLGPYRARARAGTAAAPVAGNPRRRRLRAASRAAAAGLHHSVHLQHRPLPAACRVRALRGASPRTDRDRRRRNARDVRRRHGDRCTLGNARDAAPAFRHRDRAGAGRGLRRGGCDGAHHALSDPAAGGPELLPARG